MKTLKAFIKWFKGYQLEPGEQRRIDWFLFDLKCASLTLLIVILLIWILISLGVFIGDYNGN